MEDFIKMTLPTPADLSLASFEYACELLADSEDFPVTLGANAETVPEAVFELVQKLQINWLGIPPECLKHPNSWFVWGSKCIVINEGF